MSEPLRFRGKINPRVFLTFKAGVGPDAHPAADEDTLYRVANRSVRKWEIKFDTGKRRPVRLLRDGTKRGRFDVTAETFINGPVSAKQLNEIIQAKRLTAKMTLKLRYKAFFHHLLKWMTRAEADTRNLANPTDSKAILDSFSIERKQGDVSVEFTTFKHTELHNVPCSVSHIGIHPRKGKKPIVNIHLHLELFEQLSPEQRDAAARELIAADYAKLQRDARLHDEAWFRLDDPDEAIKPENFLRIWETNVYEFLISHSPLARGVRMRDEIVQRGLETFANHPTSQREVAAAVRDEIDDRLVTANAWHQPREDSSDPEVQLPLSDAFAAILGSKSSKRQRSSPVFIVRKMQAMLRHIRGDESIVVSPLDQMAMTLQYGAAHCGDHTLVAFSVFERMMTANPKVRELLGTVIFAGNVNIDHNFVVGGVAPTELQRVVVHNPKAPKAVRGTEIVVFDLEAALRRASGTRGFVCDPYLAPGQIPTDLPKLLAHLQGRKQRRRGKATRFLRVFATDGRNLNVFPAPTGVAIVDRTAAPVENI